MEVVSFSLRTWRRSHQVADVSIRSNVQQIERCSS
ncbi:hypothetical protein DAI22_06g188403 [Oryza sativa Japonica Group]|nr:hypothetical protein DAI22_06g188403 [Oryza sativa Japonica Group]